MGTGNFLKHILNFGEPEDRPDKRWGLVLGGGGTRGAYETGAWKALKELKLNIRGISGTSIGAINAALFLQDDIHLLEELWNKIEISDILPVSDAIDPSKNVFDPKNIFSLMRETIQQKGLDNAPLRKTILNCIDLDKIYASDMDLGIVTYDIAALKPSILFKRDIPRESLVDYLLASANFPIYKTQNMDGKKFVDGGFYDNMPFNLLIDNGYTNILLIDINGIGFTRSVQNVDNVRIKTIRCSENLGGVFNFNRDRIRRNLKLGYLDTMKSFHKLFGNYFFFRRPAFNKLMLQYDLEVIRGLETAARLYKMDRYRIYTAEAFLDELLDRHLASEKQINVHGIPDVAEIRQMIEEGHSITRIERWILEQPTAFEMNPIVKLFPDQTEAAKALIELRNSVGK